MLFSTEGCHPTQTAVKTPLSLGFNSLLPRAGGCPLSPGGMEAGQPAQPTPGRGGGTSPARHTWGGGCSVASISHSGSSIVHRVTGRKELDWTSPDWNKPLLPSLLSTTPTAPPPLLPLTVIGGRMASKCRGSGGRSPAACGRWEWGSTHPNPLPRSAGNPAPLLSGEEVDLNCFAGCCTVFSCRAAVLSREQDTAESCSVTGGCCRGLKRSASPVCWHAPPVRGYTAQKMRFGKGWEKVSARLLSSLQQRGSPSTDTHLLGL